MAFRLRDREPAHISPGNDDCLGASGGEGYGDLKTDATRGAEDEDGEVVREGRRTGPLERSGRPGVDVWGNTKAGRVWKGS